MIIKNINLRNKISLLLVLTPLFLFCQQESYYSFYQYNMNVINPAFAGAQEGDLIIILDRNQWNGQYNGSPLPEGSYYYRIDLDGKGSVDFEG